MTQKLAYISQFVRVYDEAITFFNKKLGFDLVDDTNISAGKNVRRKRRRIHGKVACFFAHGETVNQKKDPGRLSGGRKCFFTSS
ncbi:MAG: VOC family protein [Chloroflexi bacterium]|nr:VOC family protein [Chloroflexota bacterium]